MKQIILKYSLIAGVTSVGYALLFYFFSKPLYVGSVVFTVGLWILYCVVFYTAGMEANKVGLSGRVSLRALFAAFVVGAAIFFAVEFALYNYFDPNLSTLQKEAMSSMYNKYAATSSPKEINDMRQSILTGEFHTVGATLISLGQRIIGGFILCFLIVYLISKKEDLIRI